MLDELNQSLQTIITSTQNNLPVLANIFYILWGVFFITRFIIPNLLLLGIIPRELRGIPGIVFAPFLHANFNHLFFNTIPLLILSDFVLIQGEHYFYMATVYIILISGFLIWCFAKPGLHIGASALITGYWGLLVSNIYQQNSLTTVILGVISLYYFAGIFYGIFPQGRKGISWEGHLFGLIAGLGASYLL